MASSPQAVLCRYHYDPLDRLAGTIASDLTDTQLFFQQNRLATQIKGAVQRTIIQHDDLLLAQQQRSDSAIETTLLATDQQRSVLQLLDNPETCPLTYSPYGHHPAESGISSLLGFNGEHRDPVTGHYLLGNGYRAFNPVLMRFNSPDSLSPFDEGGINAYAYCAGDPVNLVDPSGHSPFRILALVFRAISKLKTGARRARLHAINGPDDIDGVRRYMRFDIQSDTPYKVSGLSELPVVNNPPILYANNALPGARLSPQTLQELYKKIKDSKRYLPSDEKHPYNKFRVAKRYNNQKIVEVNSTIIANHHVEVYGPNHRLTLKSQQRAIQARQAIFRIRTSYAIRFGENIESYGTVREKRQFL